MNNMAQIESFIRSELDHSKCGTKLKLSTAEVYSCVVWECLVVAMATAVKNQSKTENPHFFVISVIIECNLPYVNTPIDLNMVMIIFLALDQFVPILLIFYGCFRSEYSPSKMTAMHMCWLSIIWLSVTIILIYPFSPLNGHFLWYSARHSLKSSLKKNFLWLIPVCQCIQILGIVQLIGHADYSLIHPLMLEFDSNFIRFFEKTCILNKPIDGQRFQ